jgi:elongation factor G
MLELLYDFSNELMERALAEEEIPVPLLRSVIREATVHNLIVPVFCGAALDFVGIQPLLDGVAHYLPSPADMPPVEGTNPKKRDGRERRKPDSDEPFCGLVFKILADRHGDLYYVRVYSGQLKASTRVYNATQDIKENAAQLWHIHASRKEQINLVEAGDIVGIIGLRNSVTGDTLCDTKHPIVLETIVFPETVISMAIEPETTAERKKLADTLTMLKKQDPTFRASESEETGQTLISGMGELHLEVIKHRLLRDFNLNVKVHKPRVSYRETVERAVEVVGQCHRQIAGQATFAKVKIRLEPTPGTTQPVTVIGPVGDQIPPELLSVVAESLAEAAAGGGQLGFPLLKVKLTVLGGEAREGESTEVAFRIAASDAFEKALREAGIVLLEPIMKLEISTPEDYLGDFIADLQQRRGIIDQTFNRGPLTVIEAHAPLAELFGYSGAMRGLSQGRANCSMEPAAYGPAPPEVRDSFL